MPDQTDTLSEQSTVQPWQKSQGGSGRFHWGLGRGRIVAASLSEERRGVLVLLSLVLLVSLFRFGHDLLKLFMQVPLFIDFAHYYAYASAVQMGINPFDTQAMAQIDSSLQIRRAMAPPNYPPVFYLFMQPFLLLSFDTAAWVWMGLGMGCMAGCAWVCCQRFPEHSWIQVTAVAFLILNFQPLLENISLGQANLVILMLVTVAWWNLHHQRPWITGLAMGMIVHIKIQFALLIIILWWMGQRRAAWHATWMSVAIGGLGLAVLGIEHYRNYLQCIVSMPQELTAWTMNLAPRGALHRVFEALAATSLFADGLWMIGSLSFLLYLATKLPRVTHPFSQRLDEVWGIGLVAVLLISPHTLEHHLVVLLLPLSLLLFRPDLAIWTGPNLVLFICATVLLSARYSLDRFPLFHQGWPSLLANGKVFGMVLLAILLARLIHEQRKDAT